MESTVVVVICRVRQTGESRLWPFRVFTNYDPNVLARLHLRALAKTT